jgi:hypothetical protein
MKKRWGALLCAGLLGAMGARAEIVTETTYRYDTGFYDPLHSAHVDADGNAWLAGVRDNSSGEKSYIYYVAKFNRLGTLQWDSEFKTGDASWFGQRTAITVDPFGNTWMALGESYHFGGLRRFDAAGNMIELSSGTGERGEGAALDVKSDATGNVFLIANRVLQKWLPTGSQQFQVAYPPEWWGSLSDLTLDEQGNAYVAGQGDPEAGGYYSPVYASRVARFNAGGSQKWSVELDEGDVYEHSVAIERAADGRVVVLRHVQTRVGPGLPDLIEAQLTSLDPDTGAVLANTRLPAPSAYAPPRGLKIAPNGDALVLSTGETAILRRVSPAGAVLWQATQANVQATAVDVDEDGNAYILGNYLAPGSGGWSPKVITQKYSAAGALVWDKRTEETGQPAFLKAAPAGVVYSGFTERTGDMLGNATNAIVNRYRDTNVVVELTVGVDVKPGSCDNPVNLGSKGVTPVALLGSADFDVTQVDPTSLALEGVPAQMASLGDVSAPLPDGVCLANDGIEDLMLKFDTAALAARLGAVANGEPRTLKLSGRLKDEFGATPIVGQDLVRVIQR